MSWRLSDGDWGQTQARLTASRFGSRRKQADAQWPRSGIVAPQADLHSKQALRARRWCSTHSENRAGSQQASKPPRTSGSWANEELWACANAAAHGGEPGHFRHRTGLPRRTRRVCDPWSLAGWREKVSHEILRQSSLATQDKQTHLTRQQTT